ncbi:hypothetical protein Plhal304r1_c014g0053591 [Plasmopara halstedii]
MRIVSRDTPASNHTTLWCTRFISPHNETLVTTATASMKKPCLLVKLIF